MGSLSRGSQKPGQISRLGEPPLPRNQPEKEREGEGARERVYMGEARLVQKPLQLYYSKGVYIP